MTERGFLPDDVRLCLQNGLHNPTKDELKNHCWRYRIEGKSVDGARIDVAVAIQGEVIVVTVITPEFKRLSMAKKKNKIEKNYEIGGYGFAVILDEIELDDPLGDGDWVPMINEIKLNVAIFETLAVTPIRLSGAHIVFIRKFLNMNQESFAKALGLARHGAVSKWEQKGPLSAGMKPGTEVLIRALMREKLGYLEFPLADIRVLVALADQTGLPEPLRLRLIA